MIACAMIARAFDARSIDSMKLLTILCIVLLTECLSFSIPIAGRSTQRQFPVALGASVAIEEASGMDALMTLRCALVKMQAMQQPNFFQEASPLLNDFHSDIATLVTIQESTIPGAGKGLFAATDLVAGVIVGFYPTHCIGVAMEQSSPYVTLESDNEEYFDNDQQSNYMQFVVGSRLLLGTDIAKVFEGNPLFVDTNPNQPIIPGWVGHLVNDGAVVNVNTEAGLLQYYTESNRRNNCVNIPFGPSPIVATVTTRAISKGDELFTSYGCLYWLQDLLQPEEEPTDVTDNVVAQSKETAKLLLSSMQKASTTYKKQVAELQVVFENL